MVMNWLMFTTIMILMMAYGPHGNSTAALLATLALIALLSLSFQAARRSVSLSSSLREERETANKRRPSRKLVNTTENPMNKGNPDVCKMGEEAHQACSDMVQSGVALAHLKFGANAADGVYLGSMAALGALTPTAMICAKRPRLNDREVREKGKEVAMSLVREETLLFAALVAARVQTNLTPDGNTTTEFGPHILWQALSIWEKVYPDKKAEDLLDNGMIQAARDFGSKSIIPFDEFLKKRQTSVPPSSALN